jgi:hypothetical protein
MEKSVMSKVRLKRGNIVMMGDIMWLVSYSHIVYSIRQVG